MSILNLTKRKVNTSKVNTLIALSSAAIIIPATLSAVGCGGGSSGGIGPAPSPTPIASPTPIVTTVSSINGHTFAAVDANSLDSTTAVASTFDAIAQAAKEELAVKKATTVDNKTLVISITALPPNSPLGKSLFKVETAYDNAANRNGDAIQIIVTPENSTGYAAAVLHLDANYAVKASQDGTTLARLQNGVTTGKLTQATIDDLSGSFKSQTGNPFVSVNQASADATLTKVVLDDPYSIAAPSANQVIATYFSGYVVGTGRTINTITTVVVTPPTPSPVATPTPSPAVSPTPSPIASPSSQPSPSPSASATPTPSPSPSVSPTPTPQYTTEEIVGEFFATTNLKIMNNYSALGQDAYTDNHPLIDRITVAYNKDESGNSLTTNGISLLVSFTDPANPNVSFDPPPSEADKNTGEFAQQAFGPFKAGDNAFYQFDGTVYAKPAAGFTGDPANYTNIDNSIIFVHKVGNTGDANAKAALTAVIPKILSLSGSSATKEQLLAMSKTDQKTIIDAAATVLATAVKDEVIAAGTIKNYNTKVFTHTQFGWFGKPFDFGAKKFIGEWQDLAERSKHTMNNKSSINPIVAKRRSQISRKVANNNEVQVRPVAMLTNG